MFTKRELIVSALAFSLGAGTGSTRTAYNYGVVPPSLTQLPSMRIRKTLTPNSGNHVLLVVLIWAGTIVALTQLFDSPLVRWEVILSAVLVFAWAGWTLFNLLEQYQYAR